MRPTCFRLAWPAMPTTSVANTSGAMMVLTRRRKASLSTLKFMATLGASLPSSMPTSMLTTIQRVSERRGATAAATASSASHRSVTGTAVGKASKLFATRTVTTPAISNKITAKRGKRDFVMQLKKPGEWNEGLKNGIIPPLTRPARGNPGLIAPKKAPCAVGTGLVGEVEKPAARRARGG